ncbi:MAG: SDR family oxidoreductase [Desulfobacterales bacterium]|nr:SDR family oxidoreductase [Desulfobacterales bacterium]
MALKIDLKGRVAIVTGGGRGIGSSVALRLAEAGADVCVTARTAKQIEETAERIRAGAAARPSRVAADATDAAAVGRVVERTGSGTGRPAPARQQCGHGTGQAAAGHGEEEYDRLLATNVKSMFLFTSGRPPFHRAEIRPHRQHGLGGAFTAAPNQSVYHLSKAAVAHFTRAMAIEWARHGIAVNAVAPGWTRTELITHLLEDREKLARYLKAIPMRRLGEPDDIAPMVACSVLGPGLLYDRQRGRDRRRSDGAVKKP